MMVSAKGAQDGSKKKLNAIWREKIGAVHVAGAVHLAVCNIKQIFPPEMWLLWVPCFPEQHVAVIYADFSKLRNDLKIPILNALLLRNIS